MNHDDYWAGRDAERAECIRIVEHLQQTGRSAEIATVLRAGTHLVELRQQTSSSSSLRKSAASSTALTAATPQSFDALSSALWSEHRAQQSASQPQQAPAAPADRPSSVQSQRAAFDRLAGSAWDQPFGPN